MESMSDAVIEDTPQKSKSRNPVLSQDSHESEGLLMKIDVIGNHFLDCQYTVCDLQQLIPPTFTLGVSQEMKQAMPKGLVLVD